MNSLPQDARINPALVGLLFGFDTAVMSGCQDNFLVAKLLPETKQVALEEMSKRIKSA